jgi:hypothetical protein
MWCIKCRQDVPGLAWSGEGYRCPRCSTPLSLHGTEEAPPVTTGDDSAAAKKDAAAAPKRAPLDATGQADKDRAPYDEWEVSEQLRHIDRILHPGHRRGSRGHAAYRREAAQLDVPHAAVPPWHVSTAVKPARKQAVATENSVSLTALTWLALSLGTMAFACGGILLGWSFVTGRQDLWNIGMPVALCGQIALVAGLVLQLERLWHHSRHAASKLETVDEQLHELKHVTTLLGTSHGSPASFYSHFSDGASPQLLLSDLKSQLDLLALKISQEE